MSCVKCKKVDIFNSSVLGPYSLWEAFQKEQKKATEECGCQIPKKEVSDAGKLRARPAVC